MTTTCFTHMDSPVGPLLLLGDGAALGANLDRDGYIFLRGVLPRDEIMGIRRQLLALADKGGWLRGGEPIEKGVANLEKACKDPEPRYLEHFRGMWKQEALHRMKHHPNVVGVFERLFGEPVLVHPMFVLRNIFPQTKTFDFTTGSHQDRIHIGGGTSYAAWTPLGECPRSKGSLIMAEGSHRRGVLDFRLARGAGGLELVDELEVDVLSATSEVDVPVPGLAESSLPLVSSTTTAPITASTAITAITITNVRLPAGGTASWGASCCGRYCVAGD